MYVGLDSCTVKKPDESSGNLIITKKEVHPFCANSIQDYVTAKVRNRAFDFITSILKPQYKIHNFSEYDTGYSISFSDVEGAVYDPTLIINRSIYMETTDN